MNNFIVYKCPKIHCWSSPKGVVIAIPAKDYKEDRIVICPNCGSKMICPMDTMIDDLKWDNIL